MKTIKKPICNECPFRKNSLRGWLGPDSPEEVIQKVHGEGGYVCHMSIAGKPQMDDSGLVDGTKYGHQCIGAIQHASVSCKRYRQPDLEKLRLELKDEDKSNILNYPEFIAHHTLKLKGKRK